jgi:hypothetical protein
MERNPKTEIRHPLNRRGGTYVGEQQNDELVDSYLMRFERFIYMEWSI